MVVKLIQSAASQLDLTSNFKRWQEQVRGQPLRVFCGSMAGPDGRPATADPAHGQMVLRRRRALRGGGAPRNHLEHLQSVGGTSINGRSCLLHLENPSLTSCAPRHCPTC